MSGLSIAHPLALMSTFVWMGFVGAISFMESWVKFKAPNVDLSVGLGIGRLVFRALNYVEWGLALIIAFSVVLPGDAIFTPENLTYFIPLAIIALQSFWMLPVLNQRATKVIAGEQLPKSYLHFYYVGAEMIKMTCLLLFGWALLN